MRLKTINDLADHLGARVHPANEATSRSIEHRIYKGTSSGCSASFEENGIIKRWERTHLRTYAVECRVGIGGTLVLSWRPLHGKRRFVPNHSSASGKTHFSGCEYQPLPTAVAEYLGVAEWDIDSKYGLPKIGSDWEKDTLTNAREHGSNFMRDLKADAKHGEEGIHRKTVRSMGLIYLLTLSVKETKSGVVRGPIFSVSGYCEGTDIDCDLHRVLFPASAKKVDEAIHAADQDGCDLWMETHGCPKCHPDGWCDEWGNEWSHEGDNWIGQPVNPNCIECKGAGEAV